MPQHYHLHGLRIRSASDHPAVDQMLRRTLRYKGAEATAGADAADLMLDFSLERAAPAIPDAARHLGDSEHGDIGVWTTDDRMFLRRGDAMVSLHPASGRAEAALAPDLLAAHATQRRDPLFYLITFSLVILLRYRGWFALHTAALARDGRGLLLVAQSDSGKSTTTLNLVRHGWHYLSDDTVLLRPVGDRVQAHSFRRNFCVDPDATAHFPELAGHDWPPSLSDATKWQVDVELIYPGQFTPTCTPHLLVLPEIADAPESRVEPVDAKVALAQLLDQGAFFLTPDRSIASRHLDLFSQLIDQTRTYRLHAGRDLLEDDRTIHALLAPLLDPNTAPD